MLMSYAMITLAVAPSVWVLRHCVSLPGGGSLGIVVSFSEASSVLALGSLFSSSAKQENNTHLNCHLFLMPLLEILKCIWK